MRILSSMKLSKSLQILVVSRLSARGHLDCGRGTPSVKDIDLNAGARGFASPHGSFVLAIGGNLASVFMRLVLVRGAIKISAS